MPNERGEPWHVEFKCGCTYHETAGDSYCRHHTNRDGSPSGDNPPAERRHLNEIDGRNL